MNSQITAIVENAYGMGNKSLAKKIVRIHRGWRAPLGCVNEISPHEAPYTGSAD